MDAYEYTVILYNLYTQHIAVSLCFCKHAWINLGIGLANGRWHYNLTYSLSGWAYTQSDLFI